MYRSIHIKGFRCFKDLSFDGLAPINLIVGRNNVGKTTLLEAIFLHAGRTNPQLALVIENARGLKLAYSVSGPAPWDLLFHNLDRSNPIEIVGVDDDGKRHVVKLIPESDVVVASEPGRASTGEDRALGLKLAVKNSKKWDEYTLFLRKDGPKMDRVSASPFPCVFVFARERGGGDESDVKRFSDLSIDRRTDPVVKAMKLVEPRLTDLKVGLRFDQPTIFADIGLPQLLPVQVLGDGMRRVLSLMTSIASCPKGVVLIDEVDAGLHHSTHGAVWRAIFDLALRLDVQIFATTHSHECLVAARGASIEVAGDVFRAHRLDRSGETIEAITYDSEALEGAIAADLEVR